MPACPGPLYQACAPEGLPGSVGLSELQPCSAGDVGSADNAPCLGASCQLANLHSGRSVPTTLLLYPEVEPAGRRTPP